jgi:hypothetical protein
MLTQSHREGLAREGYTVVCGLVPTDLIRAASDVITAFVNADLDRPETWYRHEPLEWSIVPVHQAQAFWDIRQRPTVHATFAALLGTNRLWVSMDRGVFKVPLWTDMGVTLTRASCIGTLSHAAQLRKDTKECSS